MMAYLDAQVLSNTCAASQAYRLPLHTLPVIASPVNSLTIQSVKIP